MANIYDFFLAALKNELAVAPRGTQAKLAKSLGISNQTMSKTLNWGRNPQEDERRAVARYFGCQYEDFLNIGRQVIKGITARPGYSHPDNLLPKNETDKFKNFLDRWIKETNLDQAASYLGLSAEIIKKISNGVQKPTTGHLGQVAQALQVTPEDVLNDMVKTSLVASKPVPLLGLAQCGTMGWEKVINKDNLVSSSPVKLEGEGVFSVMAVGESMLPACIAPGQIAYCDANAEPLLGDAVYVNRNDGYGSLKVFLGWFEEKPSDSDVIFTPNHTTSIKKWLKLKGWHVPDKKGFQKEIILVIADLMVTFIAPVIFVRRRL